MDLLSCRDHFLQNGNDGSDFAQQCIQNYPQLGGQAGASMPASGSMSEAEFQEAEEGGAFWSSFFTSALEALPGTLQGVGSLRASRNPNLTSYSPSLVGDSTYYSYGNNRRGFNNRNNQDEGSRTMTIVIISVVAILVLVTLFILLRK